MFLPAIDSFSGFSSAMQECAKSEIEEQWKLQPAACSFLEDGARSIQTVGLHNNIM